MERRPNPRRTSPRFTPQQKFILAVVTVLSGILLAAAVMLLAAGPAPKSTAQGAVPPTTAPQPAASPTQPAPVAAPPLPSCAAALPPGVWAESARVVDGGTLEAVVRGVPSQIRYAGVRLPEDSELNAQAAGAASALLDGQSVYLVSENAELEESGTSPRYVFTGERFINLALVEMGLARADIYSEEQACRNLFQQGEQQARADHTGVWQATPVPTATFVPMVTLDASLQPPCDCTSRPECSSFSTHADAQACYNACNDYNSRLDDDRDGLACEELP